MQRSCETGADVGAVSMLDVSVRAGVLRLLEELKASGLGILMITHDLSTAARFADRIAVMYLGRIVEEGPAGEVVRNPQLRIRRHCSRSSLAVTRACADARRFSAARRRMPS
jgi:ABC-type dipeptide/oligopeptide/nickel transport system ATPase component